MLRAENSGSHPNPTFKRKILNETLTGTHIAYILRTYGITYVYAAREHTQWYSDMYAPYRREPFRVALVLSE